MYCSATPTLFLSPQISLPFFHMFVLLSSYRSLQLQVTMMVPEDNDSLRFNSRATLALSETLACVGLVKYRIKSVGLDPGGDEL